ncbi:MAG: ATP-dependent 6-phosphofructokinase [Planctomycetota bacterium]|nr:ATP-dependent 6-phosphofructokinase [Planctomycetota bacterium]
MSTVSCPMVRRIAVLTGGGDCPGLNAVIRAVVLDALACGLTVVGVEDGYLGLIENRMRELTETDMLGILARGGTILGSNNKSNPSRYPVGQNPPPPTGDGKTIYADVTRQCLANLRERGVEAMVIIGGDGTMTSAATFASMGLPVVGVPKTIDNDIEGTEITFGFQTAVATATEAMDRCRTTADSHHRAMIVEVMGRNAGWIALHSGVAAGADVILLPEIPFKMEPIYTKIMHRSKRGRKSTLVCVSEGAAPLGGAKVIARVDPLSPDPIRLGGVGKWLAEQIEEATGVESRFAVLGHTQRGGTPVAADRVLSTLLGSHAMQLLREGKTGRMVAVQNGRLTDIDLREPAGRQRLVTQDEPLIAAARAVHTTFGDL